MSVFTNHASSASGYAQKYVAAVFDLLGNKDPVVVLRDTANTLSQALHGLSPAQARQPEAAEKWSVRDVLQHLSDSELVWGCRLRLVLAQDRPQLTGYDQDLWARRLHYERTDPRQALEQFRVLRRSNLDLLEAASPADLQRVGLHVERGEQTLEQMV